MSRILIIGNGFDIDYGFDTTYFTFAKAHFSSHHEGCPLFRFLKNELKDDSLWYDLEKELEIYVTNYSKDNTDEDVKNDQGYFDELRKDIYFYIT